MRKSRRVFVSAALLVVSTGLVLLGCSESSCPSDVFGNCIEEFPNPDISSSSVEPTHSMPAESSSSVSTDNPSSSAIASSSSIITAGSSSSRISSSSVATSVSSSSNTSTPSSSSVASATGNGAPGNCAAPQYGVPPYGAGSCVKASNGKCYTCNPDRGTECNSAWIFQLGNPSDTYWFKEVSCGSSSGSGTLTCTGLAQTGTAGSSISTPAVRCDNTTVSSGLTWTSAPNWTNPTAGTFNVSVTASCGGSNKTASCGTIVVTSASSNSLTCTGLASTGTAGTAINQPTVRCGTSSVSATFTGAPSWSNPTAGNYTITASATCSGSTQQASCGSINISALPSSSSSSPNLTCATVSQSITVGQTPSLPAVGCGSTTLSASSVTFTPNIKNAITSAQTINNLQVSATCGGSTKTANCPGTITVTAVPSSSSASGGGTGCSECSQNLTQGASGVKTAKTTRYWDSCKPSCAWTANASGSPNGAAMTCSVSGSKLSDQNAKNACESGGTGYTCANQFPWAVNNDLAYGFAASHSNGDCGKCFLLQFTSNGEGGMSGTISGKKMVVMISNIGGDVGGDQYDIMIPGGGVGLYNAFSSQISSNGGPGSPSLGQQYGGFRATCGNNVSCIRDMCTAAFGSGSSGVRGDFMKGCEWYINWFGISNNPTVLSKQITCPPELVSKYKH